MINWFFKYRVPGLGPAKPAPAKAAPAPAASPAQVASTRQAAPPRPPRDSEADWAPRLQAALGDDAALLQLLEATPVLATRLAAVQALAGETALKQAERAARQFDRRVHRLAKQRLEAVVAQRQTRARAQQLLADAEALVDDAGVAVNQLVALDRDWQALDAGLLDPAQAAGFAALRERLAAQVRERGEQLQAAQRWSAESALCVAALRAASAQAAADGDIDPLRTQQAAAQALQVSRPDLAATAAGTAALQAQIDDAAAVQARLAWLAEVEPAADAGEAAAAALIDSQAAAEAWAALPAVADPALAAALARRFDAWSQARKARQAAPPPAPAPKPLRPAKPALPSAEQQATLDDLLQAAEAALAEGQTAALQQRLQAIEQWLDGAGPLRLGDGWRLRWSAVQTEGARLKGWQAWGGARARDTLVAEAEALARLTVAAGAAPADGDSPAEAAPPPEPAADPMAEAPAEPASDRPPEPASGQAPDPAPEPATAPAPAPATPRPARPPRLKLKAHADAIQALRQRWKQLDRQSAPATHAAWSRFDAALQIAFQPLAAMQAAQQATRERNQQARQALLQELEASVLPAGADGPAAWKEPARALDRFQLAWRAFGPLEHTVPSAARAPLKHRLQAAVERIEQPLAAARAAAAAERERLIAEAQALLAEGAGRPPGPAALARVRELQGQWQDQARSLPLARPVEVALWARFKAATDAVYAEREAGFAARNAEAAAALAGREALLARLAALPADAAPAAVERLLAEVDRAWREAAELPRGAAVQLDARYHESRAAARQQIAQHGQRRWWAECDTLAERLALCDARDDAGGAAADDLVARWSAPGDLPAAWMQALAQRWAGPAGAGPLPDSEVDRHLLQLEIVFDLPATADQQAARRELKLRALKDAMEGRARANDGEAVHTAWLLALLRQGGTSARQRERLQRLLAALRDSQPGSLVGPLPRG